MHLIKEESLILGAHFWLPGGGMGLKAWLVYGSNYTKACRHSTQTYIKLCIIYCRLSGIIRKTGTIQRFEIQGISQSPIEKFGPESVGCDRRYCASDYIPTTAACI